MALQHVVLAILNNKSCTGYDIAKQFDNVLGYFWKASHQQIYRELAKLTTARTVTYSDIKQENKPNKKLYTITHLGKEALSIWLTSDLKVKTNNDDVLVKLYATHNKISLRKKILLQAKHEHKKQYERYKALEKLYFSDVHNMNDMDKLVRMTLRKGILLEKTNIDWCDECLDEING